MVFLVVLVGYGRQSEVVATRAPVGARRGGPEVGGWRLARHGDRGGKEASSFRFGFSDGRWKLGWLGRYLGDPISIEKMVGRGLEMKQATFAGLDGAPLLLRDESARSSATACMVDRAHEC